MPSWGCFASIDNIRECKCTNSHEFVQVHKLVLDKKTNDQREVTYLDMSGHGGGQYCIPHGKVNDMFMELYSRDVKNGRGVFCIEKRSAVFKLFMDIDEKTHDPDWEEQDRLEYVTVIQEDMRRFFPRMEEKELDELLKVVVCTAENAAQILPSGEGDVVKIGIHLHFPNLSVTDHEAKLIRASAVGALERQLPFSPEARLEGGWNTALDECVYEANGLRMLGSIKMDPCQECKKKGKTEKLSCTVCGGRGRIPQPRPYKAQVVINGDGVVDEDETQRVVSDFDYALSLVKIRTPPNSKPDTRFERYEGCPSYKDELSNSRTKGKKVKRFKQDDETSKAIGINGHKDCLMITPAVEKVFLRLMSKVDPKYANLQIGDATWLGTAKSPCLCVRVAGEGSSWCRNVGRDHTQNTIYFTVTSNGLSQRCFSRKMRESGVSCCDYCSERVPLSSAENMILFGSTNSGAVSDGSATKKKDLKNRFTHKRWSSSNDTKEIEDIIINVLAPSWDKRVRRPPPGDPKRRRNPAS